MTIRISLIGALLFAASVSPLACGGDDCGHPSKATYSSPPGAAGSTGCKGIPVAQGGSATEVDETFPAGTVVQLPMCLGAYPDSIATCTCGSIAGAALSWQCPI